MNVDRNSSDYGKKGFKVESTLVKNFQEHPQSILLTNSIQPILQQQHPDKNYPIGQDSSISEKLTPQKKGQKRRTSFIFLTSHHC